MTTAAIAEGRRGRPSLQRGDGRDVTTEASGRMTPETARAAADAGVDFVSAGALTHSARAIDIALEVDREPPPRRGATAGPSRRRNAHSARLLENSETPVPNPKTDMKAFPVAPPHARPRARHGHRGPDRRAHARAARRQGRRPHEGEAARGLQHGLGAGRHHLLRQEGLAALSREGHPQGRGGPLPAGGRRVPRAARPRGREGHPPRHGRRAVLAHDARRAGLHARGRALGGAHRPLGRRDGAGDRDGSPRPARLREARHALHGGDRDRPHHGAPSLAGRRPAVRAAGPLPRRLRPRREGKSPHGPRGLHGPRDGGSRAALPPHDEHAPRDRRRPRDGRARGRGHAEPRVRAVPSDHALPPRRRGLPHLRGPARRRGRAREPRGRAVHAAVRSEAQGPRAARRRDARDRRGDDVARRALRLPRPRAPLPRPRGTEHQGALPDDREDVREVRHRHRDRADPRRARGALPLRRSPRGPRGPDDDPAPLRRGRGVLHGRARGEPPRVDVSSRGSRLGRGGGHVHRARTEERRRERGERLSRDPGLGVARRRAERGPRAPAAGLGDDPQHDVELRRHRAHDGAARARRGRPARPREAHPALLPGDADLEGDRRPLPRRAAPRT